jgi:hypothetical protein
MTNEDQVVALFARANPVPSLDLLDPIEDLDMEHPAHLSARSSVMTEVETIEPKKEERQRWPRVALGLAMAVIAVAALGILVNRESGVASPESIGDAFMTALADHDGDAALELLAEDARYKGLSPLSDLPLALDLDRAIGEEITNQGCEEVPTDGDGTLVDCRFMVDGDIPRALGIEPTSVIYTIRVDEGQIQAVDGTCCEDVPGVEDPWITFRNWVRDNHPDDMATMYNGEGGAHLKPESIALFEKNTDEFVASHGG